MLKFCSLVVGMLVSLFGRCLLVSMVRMWILLVVSCGVILLRLLEVIWMWLLSMVVRVLLLFLKVM